MICINCGNACPTEAKFCSQCGTALLAQDSLLPVSLPPEPPVPEAPVVECPIPEVPDAETPVLQPEETETVIPELLPSPEPITAPESVTAPEQPEPPEKIPEPVSQETLLPVPPHAKPKPQRQGTHWIPIVIMILLCVLGATLFFTIPTGSQPPMANSDTPWFYNDNGTLYFYEEYYTGPKELTVPDLVNGQPVTALGPYCFSESSLTTVILPDTLETIGDNAFSYCNSMRGIYIPEGVTAIGNEAFYRCSSLEAICIPSSMKSIESGAFDGCFHLNYILYDGIHSHWLDLYQDMIGEKTQVYCIDGTFGQHQGRR